MSDALPLDRDPPDAREEICKQQSYNLDEFDDVSIIFVFFNEHLSTLLRSIHSVLNFTPPQLVREIILVDDGSETEQLQPSGQLHQYVEYLPKVTIMRFESRRGIVASRISGIGAAKAPIVVILDSHVEVNVGWLEPMLAQLHKSPKSVLFPRIDTIESDTFEWNPHAGIGCWLTFKWTIQERSTLTPPVDSPEAIPSPSMAGGLFAVRRDRFWELGGYDEEFSMWGAENVEMAFRHWMCGGRVECAPCSRVYHAYRKGGGGAYSVDPKKLLRNRLRTARIWMDEFSVIADAALGNIDNIDIGDLTKMSVLKRSLNCKEFSWFLGTVDPTRRVQKLSDVLAAGEIRNTYYSGMCLDTLQNTESGKPYGIYECHGQGGSQAFLILRSGSIRLAEDERNCIGESSQLVTCDPGEGVPSIVATQIVLHPLNDTQLAVFNDWQGFVTYTKKANGSDAVQLCMTPDIAQRRVKFVPCENDGGEDLHKSQQWRIKKFPPKNFNLL